ncbi:MAG: hypothetical protein FWD25_08945 [Clostridia bacterium]|nr:hypothetical protein [Clostridia bacterium]
MPDTRELTAQDIDAAIRDCGIYDIDVCDSKNEGKHLQHMLSKIEEYRATKEEIRYREKETELADKLRWPDGKEKKHMQMRMAACREHHSSKQKKYTIKLKEQPDMPPNTGCIWMYAWGAIIKCPQLEKNACTKGVDNHLCEHIVIAHEAGGHLLLHVNSWLDGKKTNPKIEEYQETQASYCAELILNDLSRKYKAIGRKERFLIVSPQKLRRSIKKIMGRGRGRYKPKKVIKDSREVLYESICGLRGSAKRVPWSFMPF